MSFLSDTRRRSLMIFRDILRFLYRRVLLEFCPPLANAIYDRLPHQWLVFLVNHGVFGPGKKSFEWVLTLKNAQTFKVLVEPRERFSVGCAFDYKVHDTGLKRLQEFFLDRAPARSLYLDIGANIGVSSIYALSAGRTCWLFEPNIALHQFGKHLFEYNGFTKARWEEVALSDTKGEARFFVSKSSFMSSFNRDNAAREGETTEIVVPTRTLDSYLPELSEAADELIIKIDVEGHEMKVLAGADNVIKTYRPPVMLELLTDETSRYSAWEYFAMRDYVCRGIYDEPVLRLHRIASSSSLSAFPAINFIFLPSDHRLLLELDRHVCQTC